MTDNTAPFVDPPEWPNACHQCPQCGTNTWAAWRVRARDPLGQDYQCPCCGVVLAEPPPRGPPISTAKLCVALGFNLEADTSASAAEPTASAVATLLLATTLDELRAALALTPFERALRMITFGSTREDRELATSYVRLVRHVAQLVALRLEEPPA